MNSEAKVKTRVLHINYGSKTFGGVSALLMNVLPYIDSEEFAFDFLTPNETTYSDYRELIEGKGGRIFELGIDNRPAMGKVKLIFALKKFFKEHDYDIVHIHSGNVSFNCACLMAVKRFTRSLAFVHSHNASDDGRIKSILIQPAIRYISLRSDVKVACSYKAARHMFPGQGKDAFILKNGIEAERFRFDEAERKRLRNELGVGEAEYLIGHIGRFAAQKNQEFALRAFALLLDEMPEAAIVFVGGGELLEEIEKKTEALRLADKVRFAGPVDDTAPYYSAFDVFFLPSLYEGLAIVGIEAQTSGLPVVSSRAMPEEAVFTENVNRLSLAKGEAAFAEALKEAGRTPDKERAEAYKATAEAGYGIADTARDLEGLYRKAMKAKADKAGKGATGEAGEETQAFEEPEDFDPAAVAAGEDSGAGA